MLSTGFARSFRGLGRAEPPAWLASPVTPLVVAMLLALPPLGSWLKATMLAHMLVQIPLMVLCGYVAGRRLRSRHAAVAHQGFVYRWPLLLCAGFTLMVWMLPRLLDLAVESPVVDTSKALSLTLLAGLPLGLAWCCLGPVVRALVHVEALATLWRLGWLYLDSPSRLCTRYAMDDQARLGMAMMGLGGAYALWLIARALGGVAEPDPRSM